jgi:hypothetical protein
MHQTLIETHLRVGGVQDSTVFRAEGYKTEIGNQSLISSI